VGCQKLGSFKCGCTKFKSSVGKWWNFESSSQYQHAIPGVQDIVRLTEGHGFSTWNMNSYIFVFYLVVSPRNNCQCSFFILTLVSWGTCKFAFYLVMVWVKFHAKYQACIKYSIQVSFWLEEGERTNFSGPEMLHKLSTLVFMLWVFLCLCYEYSCVYAMIFFVFMLWVFLCLCYEYSWVNPFQEQ
jgi:hypothetical protein